MMSPDSQCLPAIVTVAARGGRGAIGDQSLVAGAVEHRPQVVRHAAVDGDVGPNALDLLDGPHRVGGDAGVADERAAGLEEDLRHRIESGGDGVHVDGDEVLDARREVGVVVGDPEASAYVHDARLVGTTEVGHRRHGRRVGVELHELGSEVGVESGEAQVARLPDCGDGPLGGSPLDPEAELRIELPRLDVGVGRRLDPGGQPDEDVLVAIEERIGQRDLVERVDDQAAHSVGEGVPKLVGGLVVAVHVDPLGLEAGADRGVELAAGGDVDAQALLAADPVDGRDRSGLARVENLELDIAGAEGADVGACPAADVVGRIDIGGSAELLGDLDDVAAPNLEMSRRIDAAPQWVHGRRGDRIDGIDGTSRTGCGAGLGHRAILTRNPGQGAYP